MLLKEKNYYFNWKLISSTMGLITEKQVNRNSWGGDPESQGANRSAYYPRDQSLFVIKHIDQDDLGVA